MTLSWWHFGGVLMGMMQAAFFLVNSHFRVEPRLLMIWRGFGMALLMLPFLLFFRHELPEDPLFYAASISVGIAAGGFDRLIFQSALRFGAGVTSRLASLSVPVTFIFWLILHPESIHLIMAKQYFWLLPLAFGGMILSVLMMGRDPVGRTAFISLIPLYFLSATLDVLNKTAMSHGGQTVAMYVCYIFLVSLFCGFVTLLWPTRGGAGAKLNRATLFAPTVWRGGASVVAVVTLFMIAKSTSLADAPNPGFVMALGLMAPFWVMAYNRLMSVCEECKIWAGLGCVISALLLVLATI